MLALCVSFTSCSDSEDDDWIRGVVPRYFNIYVSDSKGNDLLNPETEGSIDLRKTTATIDDKTWYVKFPTENIRKTSVCSWSRQAADIIFKSAPLS